MALKAGAANNSGSTVVGGNAPSSSTPDIPLWSDDGLSNTDNVISYSKPVFSGTAIAGGATVTLRDGDTVIAVVQADASGYWEATSSAMGLGEHHITATAEGAGIAFPAPSSPLTVTIVPPATTPTLEIAPSSDTGRSDSDGYSSDSYPLLHGTADPGAQVYVYANGAVPIVFTIADASGNWSAPADMVFDGDNWLTANAINADGYFSADSAPVYYNFDTQAPDAPAVPDLAAASDNGSSNSDNLTSNTTLTLSGAAEADATVTLYEGATVLGSVRADSAGNWSFTTGALADGVHQVKATATDAAGNESAASAPLAVTIDSTPPAAPYPLQLAPASDSGISNSDRLTNDATPTVTGKAEAGTTIVLRENGVELGAAVANTAGNWSVTSAALADGQHALTATATDALGNTSAPSLPLDVIIDTAAPASISAALASDTGANGGDLITNNGTVTVSGLEPGATWQYSLNAGATWNNTSGTSIALAGDGAKAVTVRQLDAAGNASAPSASLDFTLDTQVAVPVATLAHDTGTSATDKITSDGTIDVAGLEAGATWQYSLDHGATWAAGGGAAITLSGDGAKSVQVRQTDVAGNTSAASPALNFTLDTGASATLPTPTLASDTGSSNTDRITNNGKVNVAGLETGAVWQYSLDGGATWTGGSGSSVTLGGDGDKSIVVRQTDAIGNVSAISAALDFTLDTIAPAPLAAPALTADTGASDTDRITSHGAISVSGLEQGATWQYSLNGGVSWIAGSGVSATLTGDGAKSVTVRQVDVAGNAGAASAPLDFTLDTTVAAPAAPTLAADTGRSSTDSITSNGAIHVSGLEAGAAWQYSVDGGATWTSGSGTSVTLEGDGAKSVTVRQIDIAGNVSTASSALAFTLDTSIAAPMAALALDAGASATDNITNDGAINVTGIEAGATWQYSVNGGASWSNGAGTSFTLTGNGDKSVIVRQTDTAGNTSAPSDALDFTLDTIAPAAPAFALVHDTGYSATDIISSDGTFEVSGLEAGATWQYNVGGGSIWLDGSGATFTLTGDGMKSVGVRQTDVAGNISTVNRIVFTLDTTPPPALATPWLVFDTGSSDTDGISSIGKISLSSAVSSGFTWQYSEDSGATWVNGSANVLTLTGDGEKSVIVRQIDVAGNIGPASQPLNFTLDTSAGAPTTPTLALDSGSSDSDGITNSGTVNVTGLESGALLQYSVNGGATWAGTYSSSFTLVGAGAKSVIVRQTDLAGNVSDVSAPLNFILDTFAATPAAPTLAVDTGSSSTDKITNSGAIVVSGLEAGATWQYKVGSANWVDASGASATLTGDGVKSVTVRQIDVAGNISAASSALTFTLDGTAPATLAAPVLAFDTGPSASDKITNNGAINISGLETNASWQYSLDAGATWTYGSGTSATLTGDGAKSVTVRQLDVAGNAGAASAALNFTLDTGVPATVGAPALAQDTGADASDAVTSNGTINVTGIAAGNTWQYSLNNGATWTYGSGTAMTLTGDGAKSVAVRQVDMAGNGSAASPALNFTLDTSAAALTPALALDSGSSSTDKITRNGTINVSGLEANATWEYSLNNGVSWTDGNGTSLTVSNDGVKSVTVRQTDVAGNTSASSTLNFTLDTAASAPAASLAFDAGGSGTDGITNNGAVNVTGLEAGATWQYSLNGGSSWTSGSGTSLTLTGDGAKSVTVRQTDAAGNTSAVSGALNFTLDTGKPAAPAAALAFDTGSSGTDKISNNGLINVSGLEAGATWQYSQNGGSTWSDGSGTSFVATGDGIKSISVRQTDVAGNISAASASMTFTLNTSPPAALGTPTLVSDTGSSSSDKITSNGAFSRSSLETSGATWQYSLDSGATWIDGSGTSATLTGDGAKSVIVRQTDVAGNIGPASAALNFTLDTSVATPATPVLAVDSGSSGTDKITNDGTVNVSGLETGAQLQYSQNGGASWTNAANSSFTLSGAGAKSVIVRQIDAAGNVSGASGSLDFTLDNTVAALASPTLAADTGSSATDKITSNGTFNISGLDAGATWQYRLGSSNWIDGSGTSATLTGDGAKAVTVRQTDVAGNVSTTSALNFTLDTTRPSATLTTGSTSVTSGATVSYTLKFQESVSGVDMGDFSVANGSLLSVSGSGVSYTVKVTAGPASGALSLTLNNLTSVVDLAGNETSGATHNGVTVTGGMQAVALVGQPGPADIM